MNLVDNNQQPMFLSDLTKEQLMIKVQELRLHSWLLTRSLELACEASYEHLKFKSKEEAAEHFMNEAENGELFKTRS